MQNINDLINNVFMSDTFTKEDILKAFEMLTTNIKENNEAININMLQSAARYLALNEVLGLTKEQDEKLEEIYREKITIMMRDHGFPSQKK